MKTKSAFLARNAPASLALVQGSPGGEGPVLPTAADGGKSQLNKPAIRWMSAESFRQWERTWAKEASMAIPTEIFRTLDMGALAVLVGSVVGLQLLVFWSQRVRRLFCSRWWDYLWYLGAGIGLVVALTNVQGARFEPQIFAKRLELTRVVDSLVNRMRSIAQGCQSKELQQQDLDTRFRCSFAKKMGADLKSTRSYPITIAWKEIKDAQRDWSGTRTDIARDVINELSESADASVHEDSNIQLDPLQSAYESKYSEYIFSYGIVPDPFGRELAWPDIDNIDALISDIGELEDAAAPYRSLQKFFVLFQFVLAFLVGARLAKVTAVASDEKNLANIRK